MDVAKAFTFFTEDERWVTKIGIGAVIAFFWFLIVPIVLILGYSVGIARNVMNGVDKPLPEWDDFGAIAKDGAAIMVGQLFFALPIFLLICMATVITAALGGLARQSDAASGIIAVTWVLVACSLFFISIWTAFMAPALVIQYIRTDDFASVFRVGEIMGIARDNIAHIIIAVLAIIGSAFAFSFVTGVLSIIPCIGAILTFLLGAVFSPLLSAVAGHLYGQIAAGKAATLNY